MKINDSQPVDIESLVPFPHNVKEHPREQIDDLKTMMADDKIGYTYPILIDENNMILAGHGRVQAMKELGEVHIPCIRLEGLTESEKNHLVVRDNFVGDTEYNKANLEIVFKGIDRIELEPFKMNIQEKFKIQMPAEEESQEIPQPPIEPKTKLGDIYQLGRHKIMCGDNSIGTNYEKLMNNMTVDQLLADPPYGVDYAGKNKFLNNLDKGNRIQKEIQSDSNIEKYQEFFEGFVKPISFSDYNTVYVCMSGKELVNLYLAMTNQKITPGDFLVWVKNNHVLGRKDYNAKHEFIFYGWKERHRFHGPHRTTVLEYDKPLVNDLHPTMKPVPLFCQLVTDGSPKNGVVYDPFLGSGTTLIACEQTNRICYGMEIDPGYIDVIIERWENYTGKKAIKVS